MKNKPIRGINNTCPVCHYKTDSVSAVSKSTPTPIPIKDDISVCLNCGSLNVFDENLVLRQMTPAEMQDIARKTPAVLTEMLAASALIHKLFVKTN